MNDTTLTASACIRSAPGRLTALARRLVLARLASLREGRLAVREGADLHQFGNPASTVNASLTVIDPAFYAEVAFGGSVGAGESYMLGHWRADDLTTVMRLLLRNRDTLDAMETGFARVSTPLRLAAHWLHRNTRAGSRRNIRAHYDLGNDLFELFLDPTMMYSCALFERPDMTLAEASTAKLDAVCRKLALGPQDNVLEIGSGWGGFALHAARRFGCRITTTTISPSQHALATERVRRAGLEDRVTVLLEDYRDLKGSYDKLVSIEMIEAIGHRYFGEFFRQCARRLVPGGRMLVQSITIADRYYAGARDGVDFIKRYIFPGCCIPSVGALVEAIAASNDLRIAHLEDIGPHYATTLACWRDNFLGNLERVRSHGYSENFCRMWEFYLSYCEAGFAERTLGDAQILLTRDR